MKINLNSQDSSLFTSPDVRTPYKYLQQVVLNKNCSKVNVSVFSVVAVSLICAA